MPRIRTIKPEFFDSPGTAAASYEGRLFFIALWCWADDYGVGTANPKQLIGFAFPNDPVVDTDFPRLRTEVAECFDVVWYEVNGRPFYCIPSWDTHQKNERRAARRNPTPDKGKRIDTEMHGTSVRTDGRSGIGTGEQGNRGTEEEQPSSTHVEGLDRFDEFWSVYPRKVSKKNAQNRWLQLMKRKVDPQQIINGAAIYARATRTTEPDKIKHPDGWLNGERWNDEPSNVLPLRAEPPQRSNSEAWID